MWKGIRYPTVFGCLLGVTLIHNEDGKNVEDIKKTSEFQRKKLGARPQKQESVIENSGTPSKQAMSLQLRVLLKYHW